MHDFFDVLGLPTNAAPSEVRRACARRSRRTHPDFDGSDGQGGRTACGPSSPLTDSVARHDVAIDFVDMTGVLERMQSAFFGSTS